MITSVTAFIDEILAIRKKWDPIDPYPEIWFRGVNDCGLKLLPGAYWRKQCDEISLVLSFRSMAPALLPREPLDDWEWYFLMQHYGLPTRLLDWSESPLAALYFALEQPLATKTACVWVLDPVSLNRLSGLDHIVVPTASAGRPVENWLPEKCGRGVPPSKYRNDDGSEQDNSNPLAIFPKRHNPRIVAQRGTFTVHGAAETPINALDLSDGGKHENRLTSIEIDASSRDRIWDELWAIGITKTAIYPEPQSLAEDLKRWYKTT